MHEMLIKALMVHHNDFFKMTREEQDIFKNEKHEELDDKIRDYIFNFLDFDEDSNDYVKQFEFNKIMLPYYGIGENYFMLNEIGENKDTLKYKTLYDHNVAYHEWQEKALSEDENITEYKPTKLYNRFTSWARAEINGEFYYLNLLSLEMWMTWKLEEVMYDFIDKELPHKFVPGEDDGKKTKGGYIWNKVIDANGLEGWYEQLKNFSYELISKKFEENQYLNDVVYIIETTDNKLDPGMDYVFGSMDVLKKLSFKTFINDSNNVIGNIDELMKFKDDAIKKLKLELEEELVKIKKTPPNVMKLKKKKKIVMSDNALTDILDLGSE